MGAFSFPITREMPSKICVFQTPRGVFAMVQVQGDHVSIPGSLGVFFVAVCLGTDTFFSIPFYFSSEWYICNLLRFSTSVTQARGGGSLDSQGVCVPYFFAQSLVGEQCAQLCDHGLLRMFWIIRANERKKTKQNTCQ